MGAAVLYTRRCSKYRIVYASLSLSLYEFLCFFVENENDVTVCSTILGFSIPVLPFSSHGPPRSSPVAHVRRNIRSAGRVTREIGIGRRARRAEQRRAVLLFKQPDRRELIADSSIFLGKELSYTVSSYGSDCELFHARSRIP